MGKQSNHYFTKLDVYHLRKELRECKKTLRKVQDEKLELDKEKRQRIQNVQSSRKELMRELDAYRNHWLCGLFNFKNKK